MKTAAAVGTIARTSWPRTSVAASRATRGTRTNEIAAGMITKPFAIALAAA